MCISVWRAVWLWEEMTGEMCHRDIRWVRSCVESSRAFRSREWRNLRYQNPYQKGTNIDNCRYLHDKRQFPVRTLWTWWDMTRSLQFPIARNSYLISEISQIIEWKKAKKIPVDGANLTLGHPTFFRNFFWRARPSNHPAAVNMFYRLAKSFSVQV